MLGGQRPMVNCQRPVFSYSQRSMANVAVSGCDGCGGGSGNVHGDDGGLAAGGVAVGIADQQQLRFDALLLKPGAPAAPVAEEVMVGVVLGFVLVRLGGQRRGQRGLDVTADGERGLCPPPPMFDDFVRLFICFGVMFMCCCVLVSYVFV